MRKTFGQACADLIRAEARGTVRNASADLETACADLVRAEAQRSGGGGVQAGVQTGSVEAGSEVRASLAGPSAGGTGSAVDAAGNAVDSAGGAISQAGGELLGTRPSAGYGRVTTDMLTTDPIATFTGEGINAEYSRAWRDHLSLVGKARFGRTNAAGGSTTALGVGAGFDYFLVGNADDNRGFRVGPRLEFGVGRDTVATDSTFTRLSILGEAGYNWVASNGITAILAGGLDFRLAGALGSEIGLNASGDVSPYLRLGIGYAW